MFITKDGVNYQANGRLPKDAENSFQYLLARLLIGAMQITKGTIHFQQGIDYSTLPQSNQNKSPVSAFFDFLQSASIGGTAQRYVKVTLADNRDFFREVLAEFSNYFIQTRRLNHATAFVHLYRILERISYSVPLLYCATQKDFVGTFNDLKSLFKDDIPGELGLFKKFLEQGRFIDRLKLDAALPITFVSINGYQGAYFNLTDRLYKHFQSTDAATHQMEVQFKNIPNLLVAVRNRLFHARTGDGQSNVKMQEVIDMDEYLGCLNPIFCNFLAIVTLRTIASKYQT